MNKELKDKALLTNLAGGQNCAYDRLFQTYYAPMIAYSKQYVNYSDAEEVVQELWLYIWKNRINLNIQTTFRGYLFKSCKNRCLTLIRNQKFKASSFHELSLLAEYPQENPDFYFEKELQEIIIQAIDRLPEKFKESFTMNRFEYLTYKEIAERLGVSPKTVDYRIQMALRILRKKLKNCWPVFFTTYFNSHLLNNLRSG